MSLENDDLLWSKDMIRMHGMEKVHGRLSIHSSTMIFEQRIEKVGEGRGWKNQFVTELPSENDVTVARKGFFKKVILIKIDERDHEFHTISEDTERTLREIRSALSIAVNVHSSRKQSILSGIVRTGSILVN